MVLSLATRISARFACVEYGIRILLLPLDYRRYPSTKLVENETLT